ncbi:MAG TPA: DoxX family protein [Bacteroidota bacterium]|nr:DoxX family protein [Bacteroidota bacterium]
MEDLKNTNAKHWTLDATLLLLRIASSLIMIPAGGMKLFGWFGLMPGGSVHLLSQMGIAGILEVFGGGAIALGLCTRPIAFVLSGEMAVAYWQGHAPHGILPILNHGEPAVLLCFIFLYLAARGGGGWSIDGLIRRWKITTPT